MVAVDDLAVIVFAGRVFCQQHFDIFQTGKGKAFSFHIALVKSSRTQIHLHGAHGLDSEQGKQHGHDQHYQQHSSAFAVVRR